MPKSLAKVAIWLVTIRPVVAISAIMANISQKIGLPSISAVVKSRGASEACVPSRAWLAQAWLVT